MVLLIAETCRRGLVSVLSIAWCSSLSSIVELDSPRQDRESLHVRNGSLSLLLDPKAEEAEALRVLGHRVYDDFCFINRWVLLLELGHQDLIVHIWV